MDGCLHLCAASDDFKLREVAARKALSMQHRQEEESRRLRTSNEQLLQQSVQGRQIALQIIFIARQAEDA
jgi:hypothetical protein